VQDPDEFRLSLVEHLDELRGRIVRILVFLIVGWVFGWVVEPTVYETLSQWAQKQIPASVKYEEAFRSVTEPFMLKLKLSFYIGLVLMFPFIIGQVWGFIRPALRPTSGRPFKVLAPLSFVLFFVGCALCWSIIPIALGWFVSYLGEFPGTGIIQEPGTLVFFIAKMLLAFGIGFQLPVVVFFLAKIGILTPAVLKTHWRHATVVIFFLSMILTPSNDIPSMLTMAIPMTLLFFMSMLAVSWSNRHQRDPVLDQLD